MLSKFMKKNNNLTILAIETSCDDTAIAILKIKNQKLKILSNITSSQIKLHKKYGGVYPFLAKREHQRNLPIVLNKALRKADFVNPKSEIRNSKQIQNSKFKIQNSFKKIDLIAVTVGPGLEPCLWTGINFAKELAEKLQIPIMPVNHIEAHIFANFISEKSKVKSQKSKLQLKSQNLFPAICLVVSGGHTQLILMKGFGKYKILGETRDDAAGECFDKVARILGLGYPGGPIIAKMATKLKIQNSKFKIQLPRPMMHQKNYDFSFSGLKTAVLYKIKSEKRKTKNEKYIQEMCYEIQQAIIDVLIHKTLKATKNYQVKSIILGGGVAANTELRKQFKLKIENCKLKINFLVPPKNLCLDNAVMIGITAYFHRLKNKTKNKEELKAKANLRIN
jgi:N6-L-threonylcarbamoyladenine synthase